MGCSLNSTSCAEEEAKKRQLSTLKIGDTVREKIPTRDKGRPSEHASKIFQVNERYIREVKKLKEEGKETDEPILKVIEQKKRSN